MHRYRSPLGSDKLKEKILDAAEGRFLTYGYSKTTMAEIATDSDMSAANLYRYFQSKQDIAAECAERCMSKQHNDISETVHQGNLSASQQLHVFATETYRTNANLYKENFKINGLVDYILKERKALVHKGINSQCSLIAEILAYGNKTGEFHIIDIIETARTIYSALILFDVPLFLDLFTEEEFEKKATNIVHLLIEGLKKR
ncbi:Transcriptional regulator, AcrR family [hydrothermal vent metagenome]|uniref:Transcriptional regulator, AcrR family n=1 Tax=hydrothermal vent metagenome TaxID=652676 RepID=A0A3B0ZEK4_9ZZZZ